MATETTRDPLGPPPVLTPPAGWLGFLGIKSGGRQPAQVNPTLLPTLDMDRFYRAGVRVNLLNELVAIAQNADAFAVAKVPQGKIWLVESISVSGGPAGAVPPLIVWPTIVDPSNSLVFIGEPSNTGVTGGTQLARMLGPVVALPGYRFGIWTHATGAMTAANFSIAVWGGEVSA